MKFAKWRDSGERKRRKRRRKEEQKEEQVRSKQITAREKCPVSDTRIASQDSGWLWLHFEFSFLFLQSLNLYSDKGKSCSFMNCQIFIQQIPSTLSQTHKHTHPHRNFTGSRPDPTIRVRVIFTNFQWPPKVVQASSCEERNS